MQALYVGISIGVFVATLVISFFNRRKTCLISKLTMLGMTMAVIGGFFYGEGRWIGGSLMGVGALLTIIDSRYVNSDKQS